jgi:CheY-like chemotaxis protein
VSVSADEVWLQQILTNVIGNAIKFTSQGEIRLSCSTVLSSTGSHETIISVRDSGIGISPDFLPFVFDEFKQESTGFARTHEGTGLGLTISRALARKLGGDITMESQEGVGSTVKIVLPRAEGMAPNGDRLMTNDVVPTQTTSPGSENARVLLVEDTLDTSNLIGIFLRDFNITFAYSSAEALEASESQDFDVILMDLNLGMGPDGLYVTQQIRTGGRNATKPILALSAYAMESDRQTLSAGCNDYLAKPFSRGELLEKLEILLSQGRIETGRP